MVSLKLSNNDEEKIYEVGSCEVFVKRTGEVSLRCKKPVNELKFGTTDLRLIQGISELVEDMKENEEEKTD